MNVGFKGALAHVGHQNADDPDLWLAREHGLAPAADARLRHRGEGGLLLRPAVRDRPLPAEPPADSQRG